MAHEIKGRAKPVEMSIEEIEFHREEYNGICLACGEIAYGGTEPDAEGYECEACGKKQVMGVEQAFLCGHVVAK